MSTATLSELMAGQRESLRARPARPSLAARLLVKVRTIDGRPAARLALTLLAAVLGFVTRHGIVLAACAALVIASATLSVTLAWFVTGAALFFLEARRR